MLLRYCLTLILLTKSISFVLNPKCSLGARMTSVCLSDKTKEPQPESERKGFGAPKPKPAEAEKDLGTQTYEKQAKRGVPEYNIFIRPQNGTEGEWVPVGSMTIPRDTKPSTAIYEVEKELLAGTFKLYPKLKAYFEVRKKEDKDDAFEYGYILKNFPDEEIRLAKRGEAAAAQTTNLFANWIGKITNPIDNSGLKNKGEVTLKQ